MTRKLCIFSAIVLFAASLFVSLAWAASAKRQHAAAVVAPAQHDPLFLPAVVYETGACGPDDPRSVAVADLNGDSKLDVVSSGGGGIDCGWSLGNLSVLLGKGDGTFQTPTGYTGGGGVGVAVADINGDAKPDIVVAPGSSSSFGVLTGNGDGTFQPIEDHGQTANSVWSFVVADLNKDGALDVITTTPCFYSCFEGVPPDGAISIYMGKGDGTFLPVANRHFRYGPYAIAAVDVNGDDKLDLVSSMCSPGTGGVCTKGLAVLLGNGDGTFKGAVKYDSGGVFAVSIGVSDLNRDGKPDVWIAGGSTADPIAGKSVVNVLFGNGNGTFRKPVALDAGVGSAQALATQDVNGDGVPDVVVLNQYGPIAVLLGHGDGTFAPALSFALPNPFDSARIDTAKSIAMGDMNGDGRPDVVFTGSPVSSAIVKLAVMFNNGGPHSPSTTKLVSSVNPAAPNQPVTYSATVEGESGKPITGTITFVDGSTKIEEVPLDGNRASVTTSYKWSDPVRNHAIAALYSGNLYDAGSTSATLTQYVGNFPVPTKVIVTSSLTTAVLGQPVTFMRKRQAVLTRGTAQFQMGNSCGSTTARPS